MTYILMIYTVVALGNNPMQANDWRPIGEFSRADFCESAGRQLGLDSNRYRCVRSK
jgi:hypothetical protein